MRETRNAYKILVGKPEEKRPLGRRRRKWEDNIGMDLTETGWIYLDSINLSQYRDQWWAVVKKIMNLRGS
jgi:hypothetical protein